MRLLAFRCFVSAGLVCAVLPLSAQAQERGADLAGEWSGAWGRSADTLAVTMRFRERDGTWEGSFDSQRLRVEEIPFTTVLFEPPRSPSPFPRTMAARSV